MLAEEFASTRSQVKSVRLVSQGNGPSRNNDIAQ